jgi:hypothetical protein
MIELAAEFIGILIVIGGVKLWNKCTSFICDECKNDNHMACPGGTHCDCQHMVSRRTRDQVEK